ncbi:DNA polymerase V [Escherichia coli]|uniref:DNA polymerase V n=1 Tax=Escherichia coli TaxID=562 RepID=UPI00184D0F5B|nr:DNA polymerase V [Escherichia coli]EFG9986377.1 DNA polymerase V [Escherichia coli]MCN5253965.1 DNA polymerase V [Escherichia coli]MCN9011219.1 DNA polymerase V [Escherichia coli]
MARRYEISGAFTAAIKSEPGGRRTVLTQDFVNELAKVNWNWSLHEANKWIENYVTTFKDISPNEGENRLFMLYNYGGGL